jgi:quinol monooxygenase YgiN
MDLYQASRVRNSLCSLRSSGRPGLVCLGIRSFRAVIRRAGVKTNLIIEIVRIAVTQPKREQIRRALTAWAGPAAVEPGCISCRTLEEGPDPQAFHYEGRWRTQDDLLRHLRTEHYKRLLVLMDMGSEPPLVEFHTVTETKGLDLIEHTRLGL